jgi:hypothetical protein
MDFSVAFTPELLEKLAKTADCAPIYLDQSEPELEDPAQKLGPHHWQPACATSSKLTRCLEAVRDLKSVLAPVMASAAPETEKRLIKQAVIPAYNLAIALRDLFNHVQSNCWPKLSKGQKEQLTKRFKLFGEAVPTKDGSLKVARDKIAAHLDKDLCTTEYRQFWDAFGLTDVLAWIRSCFRLLEALLRQDVFSWTRFSGYSNVWNVMNVDGKEVSFLMENNQPVKLLRLRLTISPKAGFVREARELAAASVELEWRLGIVGKAEQSGEGNEPCQGRETW